MVRVIRTALTLGVLFVVPSMIGGVLASHPPAFCSPLGNYLGLGHGVVQSPTTVELVEVKWGYNANWPVSCDWPCQGSTTYLSVARVEPVGKVAVVDTVATQLDIVAQAVPGRCLEFSGVALFTLTNPELGVSLTGVHVDPHHMALVAVMSGTFRGQDAVFQLQFA